MNTTAAATEAQVTVATIRTWCRRGVITATKTAGRWTIDAASLAHRITIGAMRATRKAAKVVFSVETMLAIGGNRWQRNDMDRVYINNWPQFAGLDLSYYGSGNISSASYRGKRISHSQGSKLLGSIDKVWYDTADGKLHCRLGYTESRVATPEEVWGHVVAGIRTAIAAL
ncbi:hypothetical protein [Streptomyces triculaminicus]|uniref:hypothetical protein n=1 Tax=Streptomyces triculaminicus TaxID=2816232 RepID=UPI0037AC259B